MGNTYTALHCHAVFSTKHRERWLTPSLEDRVWSYLGGIAQSNRIKPVQIGGVDDHVHLLIGLPSTLALSKTMQLLKGGSSAWIKDTFPEMKGFGWQDGYGAFSVSKSQISNLAGYIRGQREHHRTTSFEQEYRALLNRHGIEYEERYLFD